MSTKGSHFKRKHSYNAGRVATAKANGGGSEGDRSCSSIIPSDSSPVLLLLISHKARTTLRSLTGLNRQTDERTDAWMNR